MQMFVKTPLSSTLSGSRSAPARPVLSRHHLFLTAWYPGARRARAFGLFMSASAIAGVLGGPFAGAVMAGLGGVNGWGGLAMVVPARGLPSIVAGSATWRICPTGPKRPIGSTPKTADHRRRTAADRRDSARANTA